MEKYFWALPDENMQRMALAILRGLDVLQNLSITLQENLKGCKWNLHEFLRIDLAFFSTCERRLSKSDVYHE